jgi:hypothetical protein
LNTYGSSDSGAGGAVSPLTAPASDGTGPSGSAALPQPVSRRAMISSKTGIQRFVFIIQFLFVIVINDLGKLEFLVSGVWMLQLDIFP